MNAPTMTAVDTTIRINALEAVQNIIMCFFTKLTPMILGPPGIGKSDIMKQIAIKYKLKLIDIRLSQCDPTDLNGFPFLGNGKASYLPMDTFPLEDDPLPAGYEGWLIFLDELPSAALAVQAAAYKLILDRMVGQKRLHSKAVIAAAGNQMTDGAIVNKVGTAMQSRLVHYLMMVDPKLWSLWASSAQLSDKVISYINHKPTALHVFDPKHNDRTFACPRTWEFASRIVKYKESSIPLAEKLPSLAGCIAEGNAKEFINYCDVYQHIPSYKTILADPRGIAVTNEPSMLAAISGMIGANINQADLPKIIQYVYRLPLEFQVFALRDACKRNPKILKEKDIIEWLTVHAHEELF